MWDWLFGRRNPQRDPQADRLLNELEKPRMGTCDQVQPRLADMAEAEFCGRDPDALDEFATERAHLDTCTDCTEIYADLAKKIRATLGL